MCPPALVEALYALRADTQVRPYSGLLVEALYALRADTQIRPYSGLLVEALYALRADTQVRPYSGLPVNPLHVRACLQLFRKNPTALLVRRFADRGR